MVYRPTPGERRRRVGSMRAGGAETSRSLYEARRVGGEVSGSVVDHCERRDVPLAGVEVEERDSARGIAPRPAVHPGFSSRGDVDRATAHREPLPRRLQNCLSPHPRRGSGTRGLRPALWALGNGGTPESPPHRRPDGGAAGLQVLDVDADCPRRRERNADESARVCCRDLDGRAVLGRRPDNRSTVRLGAPNAVANDRGFEGRDVEGDRHESPCEPS